MAEQQRVKRLSRELRESVLDFCAGCADAVLHCQEIDRAIDEKALDKLRISVQWIEGWLRRGHNTATVLTKVYGFAELWLNKEDDNNAERQT